MQNIQTFYPSIYRAYISVILLTVSTFMKKTLNQNIESILSVALLAPSVHNTQPWRIHVDENTISIDIDPQYQLTDGDPTGRETIISLGIFVEAITIAASPFGLQTKTIHFQDQRAVIEFASTQVKKNKSELEALKNRVTDRSIYKHIEINTKTKRLLTRCAPKTKAKIWVITDQDEIQEVADLTAKGIGLALSNPSFRQELSNYLVVPWSTKKRGISTSSLYIPKLLAICEPVLIRLGIGLGSEVKLEHRRWESASAVILITTVGDMADYWFEAGRAYLRVALRIEELGLSQATSAATVEASNYHEDVENLVRTSQRLQSVIRIGKGAARRNHSPRVSVKELLT